MASVDDKLQEAKAAYETAQVNFARSKAIALAQKTVAINIVKDNYGKDAAITNEQLKRYGYDAAEQNIILARMMNELKTAQAKYAAAGGNPTEMSNATAMKILEDVAKGYGITVDDLAKTSEEEDNENKDENKDEGQDNSSNSSDPKQVDAPAKQSALNRTTGISQEPNSKIDWQRRENRTLSSQYVKTYTTYSGHDMVAIFEIPLEKGSITHVVGELQTISYSMYNEKMPVRVLGDMNMKSVVFGNRTVAGSMVFTVFDRHWAHKMMDEYLRHVGSNAHILTDELPPINITISMCNEYGDKSRLAIYGVTFVMEGQTMSIQDMYTENTFQYMAKDLDYLTVNVDSNGGAKGKNHDVADKPKHNGDDTKEDAPIDLPAEEEKDKPKAAADKPDYSQVFVMSEDDLKKGRNHCLATVDNTLQSLSNTLLLAKDNGVITQGQYLEWYTSLKKNWQKGRQDIDKYFENQ